MFFRRPQFALTAALSMIAVAIASLFFSISSTGAKPSAAEGTAALGFSPASASIGVGTTMDVALLLSDAVNAQGVEIAISFDPAVVQVVDADLQEGGVQFSPGDCPAPDIVVFNEVDNGIGAGDYAVVELVTSCSDGEVFTLQLSCIAPGSSALTITSSAISDPDGGLIPHNAGGGVINCLAFTEFLPLIFVGEE